MNAVMVPNVAMNGVIPANTTSAPLISPTIAQATNVTTTATQALWPLRSSSAAMTVASAAIDPTERSMPAVTMTTN